MKKPLGYSQVLSKAMRFCAYQERCIYDLKLKNYEWGLKVEDFEKLITELERDNFLCESRFVESFIRGKFYQKKWGRIKIREALLLKGIDSTIIDNKMQQIPTEDYEKTIAGLLEKKMQQLKDDPEGRIKAQRFLLSKGYELEEILQVNQKMGK